MCLFCAGLEGSLAPSAAASAEPLPQVADLLVSPTIPPSPMVAALASTAPPSSPLVIAALPVPKSPEEPVTQQSFLNALFDWDDSGSQLPQPALPEASDTPATPLPAAVVTAAFGSPVRPQPSGQLVEPPPHAAAVTDPSSSGAVTDPSLVHSDESPSSPPTLAMARLVGRLAEEGTGASPTSGHRLIAQLLRSSCGELGSVDEHSSGSSSEDGGSSSAGTCNSPTIGLHNRQSAAGSAPLSTPVRAAVADAVSSSSTFRPQQLIMQLMATTEPTDEVGAAAEVEAAIQQSLLAGRDGATLQSAATKVDDDEGIPRLAFSCSPELPTSSTGKRPTRRQRPCCAHLPLDPAGFSPSPSPPPVFRSRDELQGISVLLAMAAGPEAEEAIAPVVASAGPALILGGSFFDLGGISTLVHPAPSPLPTASPATAIHMLLTEMVSELEVTEPVHCQAAVEGSSVADETSSAVGPALCNAAGAEGMLALMTTEAAEETAAASRLEPLVLLSPASATRHIIDEMLSMLPTPTQATRSTSELLTTLPILGCSDVKAAPGTETSETAAPTASSPSGGEEQALEAAAPLASSPPRGEGQALEWSGWQLAGATEQLPAPADSAAAPAASAARPTASPEVAALPAPSAVKPTAISGIAALPAPGMPKGNRHLLVSSDVPVDLPAAKDLEPLQQQQQQQQVARILFFDAPAAALPFDPVAMAASSIPSASTAPINIAPSVLMAPTAPISVPPTPGAVALGPSLAAAGEEAPAPPPVVAVPPLSSTRPVYSSMTPSLGWAGIGSLGRHAPGLSPSVSPSPPPTSGLGAPSAVLDVQQQQGDADPPGSDAIMPTQQQGFGSPHTVHTLKRRLPQSGLENRMEPLPVSVASVSAPAPSGCISSGVAMLLPLPRPESGTRLAPRVTSRSCGGGGEVQQQHGGGGGLKGFQEAVAAGVSPIKHVWGALVNSLVASSSSGVTASPSCASESEGETQGAKR